MHHGETSICYYSNCHKVHRNHNNNNIVLRNLENILITFPSFSVICQLLCGYSTLPLYAIVSHVSPIHKLDKIVVLLGFNAFLSWNLLISSHSWAIQSLFSQIDTVVKVFIDMVRKYFLSIVLFWFCLIVLCRWVLLSRRLYLMTMWLKALSTGLKRLGSAQEAQIKLLQNQLTRQMVVQFKWQIHWPTHQWSKGPLGYYNCVHWLLYKGSYSNNFDNCKYICFRGQKYLLIMLVIYVFKTLLILPNKLLTFSTPPSANLLCVTCPKF